jgi:hypothetical protein
VVFHPTRSELTCSGLAWHPAYGLELWIAWQGTLCTDWYGGQIGKVPGVRNMIWLVPDVRIGNVDSLERYLCTDWDCGWFGKVPGVWFGLWSVPSVRNGIVDGLERYLMYRLGLWMVWKGAWSTIWLMIVSVIESRV